MKVTLQRINNAVLFEGSNEAGNTVVVEGSPEIGGTGKGIRPMEMLLISLASCSSMDVVSILQKKRQPLDDLKVEVTGVRAENEVPKVFKSINMHFIFKGNLRKESVEQAVRISVEKYCSVVKMLQQSVEITYTIAIES
jgi:putative redox protein